MARLPEFEVSCRMHYIVFTVLCLCTMLCTPSAFRVLCFGFLSPIWTRRFVTMHFRWPTRFQGSQVNGPGGGLAACVSGEWLDSQRGGVTLARYDALIHKPAERTHRGTGSFKVWLRFPLFASISFFMHTRLSLCDHRLFVLTAFLH